MASLAMLALPATPALAAPRPAVVAVASTGDTYTWTGDGTNTEWSDAQNWTCSGPSCVSGSTPITDSPSDVVFPASLASGVYDPAIDQAAEVNSLTMDSVQYYIVGSASLTVDGATTLEGQIGTGGDQTYNGPVTVAGNANVTDQVAGSLVTFNGAVNADVADTETLSLPSAAVFNAPVGNSVPLWGLIDQGEYPKTINTSDITVSRGILLLGPVTLAHDSTLTSPLISLGAVNGAYSMTANGDGDFRGGIGDTTPLAQLTVTGGTTVAGDVTTTGSQIYEQGLYLSSFQASTILTGAAVRAGGPLTTDDGSVTINGPATLSAGGSQITDLSVTGSLTVTSGTLELTGNLDVGGTLDASGATVNLDGDGTQQLQGSGISVGDLNLAGGNRLDLDGNSLAVGDLTGGGGLADSGGAATLTLTPSGSDGYGGAISGPVSLAMNGTGSLNLSGALNYSGTTTVSSGTLNFQADPAGLSGITDDGQVGFDLPGDSTFRSVISGSGGVTQSGSGTLTLNAANTYSSTTTVDSGLIRFFNLGNLGTGNVTLNGGGLQWATGNFSDISSRLNPIGPKGATIDTGGSSPTFWTPLSGSGSLTITGSGWLELNGENTYSGETIVESGELQLSGSLAGGLDVESGAYALVGTINGPVTVNQGRLSCESGTLNGGPVVNNGGTLTGAPDAPTNVQASAGTGQATVSFTPGRANCSPLGSYTVTAEPGGKTATGSGSPITVTGLSDNTSYTFTVTETNPIGSTTSAPSSAVLTGPGAPTATISSPSNGNRYTLNETVPTSFRCSDGAGGPGIASCVDSNGASRGTGKLDTGTLGLHVYTVTATSHDGQHGAGGISYTVVSRPSNKFTTAASSKPLIGSCGITRLKLRLPGPGQVKVLETFAPHAAAFGQTRATAAHAESLKLTVEPNRQGTRLIRRHRRLRLTLKVSFTPTGGATAVKTIRGVRVHGACSAPR